MFRQLAFKLPAEFSHDATLSLLKWLYLCRCLPKVKIPTAPVKIAGIKFPNRVGLAAGLDKNAKVVNAMHQLGFGFIEVGTVTPKPQLGNPKPRLFRLEKNKSLINCMGFNNLGVDTLIKQLEKIQPFTGVLGINIGKNKVTPILKAIDDYVECFNKVYPYASYITVNISSPNTPDLRDLQHGHYLSGLLSALKTQQRNLSLKHRRYVPIWLKLAPDLMQQEIYDICHTLKYYEADGVIVNNTSINRNGLIEEANTQATGGLSGQAIFEVSNQILTWVRATLPKPFPVIAVGGIMSAEDAYKKCQLGADLIQLYTGLIYSGPALIMRCALEIDKFFK